MASPVTPRRRDIDGLRGLAIALVVAFHVVPQAVPGGFVGVDVFFVISGYLISTLLVADQEPGRVRRFYERRARRLLPALAVVLATTLALGHLLLLAEQPFRQLARHALAATLFVANFAYWAESGYFDAEALEKPLLHLWSLGVEEQFYLAWPALLWWLLRRPRRVLPATIALAASSFAATIFVAPRAPEATFYLPWFRLWELLAGALVAWLPPVPERRWHADLAAWAGLASVLASAALIDPARPYPSWSALGPVVGTALLLRGGQASWLGREALGSRLAVGLGLVSYPLYLWHWPLLVFQGFVEPEGGVAHRLAAVTLALLLAVITWLLVERPAQALYRRRPVATTAVLAATVALLAHGAWLLQRVRPPLRPSPAALFLRAELDRDISLRRAVEKRPCGTAGELRTDVARRCTMSGPEDGTRPLVSWGDSTARSWAPAVHAVAAARGVPAVVVSVPGCPPLVGVFGRYADCTPAAADERLGFIASRRPSFIVVTGRWGAFVNAGSAGGQAMVYVAPGPGGDATLESSRAAVSAQLPATLRRLAAIAPVVVVAAPPDLQRSPSVAMPLGGELGPTAEQHRAQQAPVVAAFAIAESECLPLRVVDPATRLCSGGRCRAVVDGALVYKDTNHVTAQGALLFADELAAAIRGLEQGHACPAARSGAAGSHATTASPPPGAPAPAARRPPARRGW